MKKIISLILIVLSFTILTSCETKQTKTPMLKYEKLSSKEEYLLNLTGNKVLMYNLTDLPTDKRYEISLIYEVYEGANKIKEEKITGIRQDDLFAPTTIGINLQANKIKFITAYDGSYASGNFEVKEDFTNYAQAYFTGDTKLTINSEFYIFYANNSSTITTSLMLGTPMDIEDVKNALRDNESSILIKLSYKEIE